MVLTHEDRRKGGKAVARKNGSVYMSNIGKRGRKKQLEALKLKALDESIKSKQEAWGTHNLSV